MGPNKERIQLNAYNREELNPPEVLVHLFVNELLNLFLREKRINRIRITKKKRENKEATMRRIASEKHM